MARVTGLERKQAPWHLRWFYGVMRKMFGKEFTPVKIRMRVPANLKLRFFRISACQRFSFPPFFRRDE